MLQPHKGYTKSAAAITTAATYSHTKDTTAAYAAAIVATTSEATQKPQ